MFLRNALSFAIAFMMACHLAPAQDKVDEKQKLQIGVDLPRLIVEFESGHHKQHCGCPSVMLKNRQARGLIIWSKGVDDATLTLVQEVDRKWIDGGKKQAYLVLFDGGKDALREKLGKTPLQHVSAGFARNTSLQQLRLYEVDTDAMQWVFLVDQKRVTHLWSFKPGELSKEKQQEILAAAEKHFVQ